MHIFKFKKRKSVKNVSQKNTSLVDSNDSVLLVVNIWLKGYPDKRRKNNKAIHCVTKQYKCNDCEHSWSGIYLWKINTFQNDIFSKWINFL